MSVTLGTYNAQGKKIGDMKTDSVLFTEKMQPGLVHEVYTLASASMRQGGSHTKTRGEVRGGGKKPWKQKGTGRARHGSTRSPIWVGGGITFGPRTEKNYTRKINKQAARKALRMVVANRAENDHIFVMADQNTDGKTKGFVAFLTAIGIKGRSVLVVTGGSADTALYRAGRNITRVDVLPANEINITELLEHQYLVMSEDAIKSLEQLFVK
ncbi:MAG: 50S ribosomal protein L4 [Candidatus Magasanikbacteria bacterium RIFCSPHIGHO2_01_FULL_50_8]|uniref:Large ribosomal subunit protein uL4 n=2 Tax=Candidatus Magasanikiibacteriota TaxID=1752731 RepID=A0A1F6LR73_9BACT|nr:MAG: 50S ribosomal protein L4 [Candidatus Magasanikbacteria bacterium RIFCSPHIGHO2_01_FULL_50_8]OGH68207.1 MAG: 50S ribosomal protein L4 [Candidatus Magasanikbacteria bacterium RIFCSPHIGHO2_02_FULL_50_9b]